MSTIFIFGKTLILERFFYHTTIPVGFDQIVTYIWFISECKFTHLQESEMNPTGWTLLYLNGQEVTKGPRGTETTKRYLKVKEVPKGQRYPRGT